MLDQFDTLPWEGPTEGDEVEFELCPTCNVSAIYQKTKLICPTCKTILENCCGD